MAVNLVARISAELAAAAKARRPARVPTVSTSANMALRRAPTFLTSSPDRFVESIFSSYDEQKPELITIQKTAASYDLVAGDLTAFLTGREWTTNVYGIGIELLCAQNTALPDMQFTCAGATTYGDAISQTVVVAAPKIDANFRQQASIVVLPSLTYNGAQLYVPFALRPAFGVAPLPLLKNILVSWAAGAAPPAGTVVTYTLLTRGTTEIDDLMRWYLQRRAGVNALARIGGKDAVERMAAD